MRLEERALEQGMSETDYLMQIGLRLQLSDKPVIMRPADLVEIGVILTEVATIISQQQEVMLAQSEAMAVRRGGAGPIGEVVDFVDFRRTAP